MEKSNVVFFNDFRLKRKHGRVLGLFEENKGEGGVESIQIPK